MISCLVQSYLCEIYKVNISFQGHFSFPKKFSAGEMYEDCSYIHWEHLLTTIFSVLEEIKITEFMLLPVTTDKDFYITFLKFS